MKFSTITSLLSLASIAVAAPAGRDAAAAVKGNPLVEVAPFNNFEFKNLDLQYLRVVNGLDMQAFVDLQRKHKLDLSIFEPLFREEAFNVKNLMELQTILILIKLSSVGLFDNRDLSRLRLGDLNFAKLEEIAKFDLGELIGALLKPQLKLVVDKAEPLKLII